MLRRLVSLFTVFLTTLSLLLFCAIIAVWLRSFWFNDSLSFYSSDPRPPEFANSQPLQVHFLSNYRASFATGRYTAIDDPEYLNLPPYQFKWRRRSSTPWPEGFPSAEKRWSLLGFAFLRYTPGEWVLIIPHGCPALLFAIAPVLLLRRTIRRRLRRSRGLCPHCGYDLRASPDRCPECGSIILESTNHVPLQQV